MTVAGHGITCRQYWVILVVILGGAISVKGWLSSVPYLTYKAPQHRKNVNAPLVTLESKKEDSEEDPGLLSRFFSSSKKEEKSINPKEKASKPEEESSGLFKSISKRLESRREAREAREKEEKEKELTELLKKEMGDKYKFPSLLNTSKTVSSTFQKFESDLTQARDNLKNVRAVKDQIIEEERRLELLRKRVSTEREMRVVTQKIADLRMVERRERKKQERADKEEEANKKHLLARVREAALGPRNEEERENADNDKRSNPLSVAQKFVSSFVEKQRSQEQWIVVAPKTIIAPGAIVPITSAGLDLLLVASKDGSALHCIANSCPHLGTPLETGMLERRPIELQEGASLNSTVDSASFGEQDIAQMLAQDGCEDCIVCPLHKTAFALESGEVRGEWCPYPPIIGKMMGTVKNQASLPVFDVRTKGKNIEVRLNTPFKSEA